MLTVNLHLRTCRIHTCVEALKELIRKPGEAKKDKPLMVVGPLTS